MVSVEHYVSKAILLKTWVELMRNRYSVEALLWLAVLYNAGQSNPAREAKLADARDLKSRVSKETYRFNSGPGHHDYSNCN